MEEIKTMKEKDMNDVTSKQKVARVVGKILIYLFLQRLTAFRPLYNLPGNLLCAAVTLPACCLIVSAFKKIPGLKLLVS